MKIKEHDCVVLTANLPDEGLEAGDVGTVVHIHKDGAAYEVEVVTLTGRTVAVVTVVGIGVWPLLGHSLLPFETSPENVCPVSRSRTAAGKWD